MSETLPEPLGCPWPVDPACLGQDWDDIDVTVQDRAVALASATLHRLTGYRVGGCPITVRPCKKSCVGSGIPSYWDMRSAGWVPLNMGGAWINSCGCGTDCSCTTLCEVVLPAPVGAVIEVKWDGDVVPTTDYRLDANSVVWIGEGECPWPTCQEMSLADTEPGTFSVTYLNSYAVDALGAWAAGTLAMEYARACSGGKCRLPSGVTSIVRQGVSMQLAAGAFPGGVTGIREVDAYIALWNPQNRRQSTRVWSPDVNPPRVTR